MLIQEQFNIDRDGYTTTLDRGGYTTMFFITEQAKETAFDFSQGTI